jgi:hypothetical protein
MRLLLIIAVAVSAVVHEAQACSPPTDFRDTEPPTIEASRLVAHTEEIVIAKSLHQVIAEAEESALEDTVQQQGSLPSVAGTYPLTPRAFGGPGSRRLVCLTDGSTLREEVVALRRDAHSRYFHYIVWCYTTESARPIQYGVGTFEHIALPGGRTHIRWTYAFALRRDRFPGFLGPLGNWLFRVFFLERDYAAMMRATLRDAE